MGRRRKSLTPQEDAKEALLDDLIGEVVEEEPEPVEAAADDPPEEPEPEAEPTPAEPAAEPIAAEAAEPEVDWSALDGITVESALKSAAQKQAEWDAERQEHQNRERGRVDEIRRMRERLASASPAPDLKTAPGQPATPTGGELVGDFNNDGLPIMPADELDRRVQEAVKAATTPTAEQVAANAYQTARSEFVTKQGETGEERIGRFEEAGRLMFGLIGDTPLESFNDAEHLSAWLDAAGHSKTLAEHFPELDGRVYDFAEAMTAPNLPRLRRAMGAFNGGDTSRPIARGPSPVVRVPEGKSPAARGSGAGPTTTDQQRADELSAIDPLDMDDKQHKELQALSRRLEGRP